MFYLNWLYTLIEIVYFKVELPQSNILDFFELFAINYVDQTQICIKMLTKIIKSNAKFIKFFFVFRKTKNSYKKPMKSP